MPSQSTWRKRGPWRSLCAPPDTRPASVCFLYTFRLLMFHDAFCHDMIFIRHAYCGGDEMGVRTTKLLGSIRRSGHVPGQPDVAYELPAQSPI